MTGLAEGYWMGRALGALLVVVGFIGIAFALPTVRGFRVDADDTEPPVVVAAPIVESVELTTTTEADIAVLAVEAGLVPGSAEALAQCNADEADRMAPINAVLDATPAERLALRTPAFEEEYHRAVVGTMYCQIFLRPADGEGLEFWSDGLADGLGVYDLYLLLAESEEYQLRDVQTQTEVLESLQLSQDLQAAEATPDATTETTAAEDEAEKNEAAADTTVGAGDTDQASAQTTTVPAPEPTTSTTLEQARDLALELDGTTREEGLRIRIPIAAADFDQWVAARALQNTDYVTDALVHGTRHGNSQMINVAYVHLSRTRGVSVSPGSNRRATVGTWAEEIGAHVAVNGNWYAPWDGPAVSGGVSYAGNDHNYTSLFGFTEYGDSVIEHHRDINDGVDPRIVEGVSGHPTLIYRGEPTTDFGTDPTFLNRNPRTAIGLDVTGDVMILVTVDGRRNSAIGMTGAETVQLMAELGAYDAVMLDGGGSSTMWLADRGVVNQPSGSLRAVGNQIAVFGN